MRLLFEITHPAHVHIFKHAMRTLQERGHVIAITARDKDVTLDLLRAYGFEYCVLSRQGKGLLGLGRELLVRDWRLWRFARRFRPDLFVGRIGTCAAHVAALMRRPVLVFEDIEPAVLQQRITYPFATRICTAEHYQKDWGRKHVRFRSFDQLAYLHPGRFTPDPRVVERVGLTPGEYILVRFVAWRAAHDAGQSGIEAGDRLALLEALERHGRVVVTSEAPLPGAYERSRLPVPPADLHHVLAFARLALGESATIAAEAAMLGVPAVLISTLRWGYIDRLRDHYQLVFQTSSEREGMGTALKLLDDPQTPELWRRRRAELLRHEGDLTAWIVREIESFAPSGARVPAGNASGAAGRASRQEVSSTRLLP